MKMRPEHEAILIGTILFVMAAFEIVNMVLLYGFDVKMGDVAIAFSVFIHPILSFPLAYRLTNRLHASPLDEIEEPWTEKELRVIRYVIIGFFCRNYLLLIFMLLFGGLLGFTGSWL